MHAEYLIQKQRQSKLVNVFLLLPYLVGLLSVLANFLTTFGPALLLMALILLFPSSFLALFFLYRIYSSSKLNGDSFPMLSMVKVGIAVFNLFFVLVAFIWLFLVTGI